jgi:hypothetical protein
MLKRYVRGINFIIRYSLFDIRYSFRAHGTPVVIELPTAKELAKYLQLKIEGWRLVILSLQKCGTV